MPSDPQTRTRQSLLAAGLLAFLLLGAGQAVMGPALPVFRKIFSIDLAAASWMISALGIGSFSGLVVLYFFGRFATPTRALLVMIAGAALIAASPNFPVSVAACALFGLGYGAVAAQFNVRILTAFGVRGPSMLSLLNAGYSVGAILAPLLFVTLGSNPRLLFGIIAALTALTIVITGKTGNTKTPPPAEGISSGFRFHLPILAFGLVGIGVEVSLTGLGPSGLIRAGIDPARAAELLSAFFVAFLAGRLGLTLVADRIPPFAIFIAAVLLTAVCAFACGAFDPAWFFPPMGFSAGLIFPGYFVTAAAKMGSDSRVAPVILATTQIGAVTAPLIIGQLVPQMGDRGFFWLIGGTSAAIGLIGLATYRRMQR
ncbi:MAG: MFS transporter [bacterium]